MKAKAFLLLQYVALNYFIDTNIDANIDANIVVTVLQYLYLQEVKKQTTNKMYVNTMLHMVTGCCS